MKFWALVQMQWWDLRRNPMIISFAVVVIGMSALESIMSSRLGGGSTGEFGRPEFLAMMLVMTAYFVGWNVACMGLAEEKEKRTLEATLLAPVRPVEILIARAFLATVLTVATAVAVILVFGQAPARPLFLVPAFLLTTLFAVAVGTLMGLLLPDLKTVGSMGTPVLLVLIMGTGIPWDLFLPVVWKVGAWLPTVPVAELLRRGVGARNVPVLRDTAVLAAYTGLVVWLCAVRLRRWATAPK